MKNILIAIICLFIGALGMYFIKIQKPVNNPETTVQILQSCLNAINALNTQGNTCLEAYKEFNTCASDIKTCDMTQAKTKLQNLELLRLSAVETMKKESAVIDNIAKELGIIQ